MEVHFIHIHIGTWLIKIMAGHEKSFTSPRWIIDVAFNWWTHNTTTIGRCFRLNVFPFFIASMANYAIYHSYGVVLSSFFRLRIQLMWMQRVRRGEKVSLDNARLRTLINRPASRVWPILRQLSGRRLPTYREWPLIVGSEVLARTESDQNR